MKKLLKLMAVAVLALAPLMVGAPVAAQRATCEVGFTGPNSENMCTSLTQYTCEVNSENNVTITSSNEQDGASGDVTVSGNTTGGNGVSGTVTNENGTTFNVTITNPAPNSEEPGTCVATVTVPATNPPTPVEPTNGGGGGAVEELPVTSGDTTLSTTALVAGIAALLAALSVGGTLLYRHLKASS